MDKYSVGTPTFSQTGPSLGSKERLQTAEEEQWLAELDLLTRFNEANSRFIKTTRPRLTRIVTTKHVDKLIVQSIRLRITKTDDAGKSA